MLLLLAVSLLTAPQAPAVRPQAPAQPPTIQDVRWLAGCWMSTNPQDNTHEYWFEAGGDALLGLNRSIKSGALASYEFMVIRATPAGLSFTAKPSGQPEATFIAERVSDAEVVFSNPKHDFPQRVIYRREGTVITGRIEGTQDGKARSVDFPFRRMVCPYAPVLM